MAEPYIGEIRVFSFSIAPVGWAQCDGTELSIAQNPDLFQVIGNAYGGDGRTTFNLPDMRCRSPIGYELGTYNRGSQGGEESVMLTANMLPPHTHDALASTDVGNASDFAGNIPATSNGDAIYTEQEAVVLMKSSLISKTGGDQAHDNMTPFLVVNFCIALIGTASPDNAVFTNSNAALIYQTDASNLTSMDLDVISGTGNGDAHNNMSPYLTISFIIACQGTYPQRP
ncbi:MAG: tail fiber protein [Chloroflexota bacterium]